MTLETAGAAMEPLSRRDGWARARIACPSTPTRRLRAHVRGNATPAAASVSPSATGILA